MVRDFRYLTIIDLIDNFIFGKVGKIIEELLL